MPDLGLQTQAQQHFGFLVSENGYRCTQSTPYRIHFESPTTFIELVYEGNRSFELGLRIGKTGVNVGGNPPFSIDEILRLHRAPEAKKFSLLQVTSPQVLASFVEQLAQMLRAYGGALIDGSEQSFADLAEQRRGEIKAYALERNLREARAEADTAWHKKDYRGVVKALKPLRASLTAAEVGKLEFAEKHSGPDNYD
jgi:hypothetical protein